ncbi:zinc ribbon domain-containing protein [Fictibacillus phosphorivorans]|uniref:zinc ribbon domain-containing protein n=1 Tax=Fictibacillus phosphorivorans TaxID=1221500 RepID=UPI0032E7F89B
MENAIQTNFKCSKCSHRTCRTKEVAMTGSGLSKLLDIQHNHFLFVSCMNCGYVEVYNPDVLEGKKGQLSSILDILFG